MRRKRIAAGIALSGIVFWLVWQSDPVRTFDVLSGGVSVVETDAASVQRPGSGAIAHINEQNSAGNIVAAAPSAASAATEEDVVETPPSKAEWRGVFRSLEFADSDAVLEERLANAEQTLKERFGDTEGTRLYEAYAQYANYRHLAQRVPLPPGPGNLLNPHRQLQQLHDMRLLAQSMMDDEVRQAVVDPWLNRRQYRLEQAIVLEDDGRYGDEKRADFDAVRTASNSLPVDNSPNVRYQQLLALYARDLAETDDTGKAQLRDQLRREVYGR